MSTRASAVDPRHGTAAGRTAGFAASRPAAESTADHHSRRAGARDWAHRWAAGWLDVAHLVLNLPLGGIWLVVPILILTGVLTIPALGIGILIGVAALWIGAGIAWFERHRAAAFLGVDVRAARSDPRLPWWQAAALDPVRWRESAGVTLLSLWGLFIGTVVTSVLSWAVALAIFPLYISVLQEPQLALPWSSWTPVGVATEPWELALLWALGVLGLLVAPLIAPWLTQVDRAIVRWFLGESPARQMNALQDRARDLDRSRAATVDSVEAERRRIERDLHDGPQQKLVSVAMDIGLARSALRSPDASGAPGPARDAALEHLERAHGSAKDAITEMRQVARGIVPPVLADRGLDAALSALAVRAPVPVDVHVDPRLGRLDPSIEAIAYFCVSEGLTNVAKHAAASRARVVLAPAADGSRRVVLSVEDDGVGGARFGDVAGASAGTPPGISGGTPAGAAPGASTGTGLTGLRQRVAAVDGHVALSSPPGGPTVLSVALPWRPAAGTWGGAR